MTRRAVRVALELGRATDDFGDPAAPVLGFESRSLAQVTKAEAEGSDALTADARQRKVDR